MSLTSPSFISTRISVALLLTVAAKASASVSICSTVASPAVAIPSAPLTQEASEAPGPERFLEVAAEAFGVSPSEIELQRLEGPIQLKDSGLSLYVRSAVVGEERAVIALDALGNAHDLQQAVAQERRLAEALRGKRTRRLEDALNETPEGKLDVMVWLAAPDVEEIRRAHGELVSELDQAGLMTRAAADAHADELQRQVEERITPVTNRFAESMRDAGREVVFADAHVPVVFLRLDGNEIAALETDPSVQSLDFAGGEFVERMNVARSEVRANVVHTAIGGNTGEGVRVGIVEGGRICTNNSNLQVSGTRMNTPVSTHTTGVASCVKSTHSVHRGVAPGSRVYSANGAGGLSSSAEAINWAIWRGCQILNLSYGAANPGSTVSAFDRYLDAVVRSTGRTITIACGNSGNYAGDPGAGYNAIAVGNFNDNGSSVWSGESMAGSSSWRNPTTGVETPQVAAPGTMITMLSCGGGTNYTASGTSFSAPIVAGTAALMISENPVLGSWPEAVRAILMATAWHNIEGARALSSRDGAGGIDARAAWRVVSRGWNGFRYGTLTRNSFSGSGWYTAQRSYATVGSRVRCAVSWNSTPSGGSGYDVNQLLADFDLFVYRPDGQITAISASAIQPFEVVEFTASQSGYYELRLRRRRFSGTIEYFGTAMTVSSDI